MDVCTELGLRIRALREERGMSQDMLADRCGGLSRVNLSRIERGVAEPGCRTMQKIAHALGLKFYELIDGLE